MTQVSEWLKVDSLDLEAQGVAHNEEGKVVFIEGALPGEQVQVTVGRKKNNWEQGTMVAMRRESPLRVAPGCPHFGLHTGACGGCKMQHLHAAAQVAVKQRVLEDNLWHLGKVRSETLLRPIEGPTWGYRYRARLSVRYVHKKGEVLVGFHERKSRYVADMRECHVLPPHVSALLLPLRALIHGMEARETCPQIELACGDAVTALVLRHLEPLLRFQPAHADGLRLRAEALDAMGHPSAVAAYRLAADAAGEPGAQNLRAKGALAQIKQGDPKGALQALEGLRPTSVEGRLCEALAQHAITVHLQFQRRTGGHVFAGPGHQTASFTRVVTRSMRFSKTAPLNRRST